MIRAIFQHWSVSCRESISHQKKALINVVLEHGFLVRIENHARSVARWLWFSMVSEGISGIKTQIKMHINQNEIQIEH